MLLIYLRTDWNALVGTAIKQQENTDQEVSGETCHDAGPEELSVLSRRSFVKSALGVGAAVAVLSGEALLAGCAKTEDESDYTLASKAVQEKDIPVLEVTKEQIIQGIEFDEAPVENYLELVATYYLPVGSLFYQIDSEMALVLLPGMEGESLRKIGLLDLSNGEVKVIVEKPIGNERNLIIYDARASRTRVIWVEVNLGDLNWKTYVAPISEKQAGRAVLVDEGNADYEPPMMAVYGNKAYWTFMPMAAGKAYQEDSFLRALASDQDFGSGQVKTYSVLISHGRMITNPLITEGIITLVPRVDTSNIYYQLTALRCADDKVVTYQALPQSYRVSDAIYMKEGFAFSVENNYKDLGGISNLGTYQQLSDGNYLYVRKPPTNAIACLDDHLIVKSTSSVIGLDPVKKELFIIRPPQQCSDSGETLIGCGILERIILASIRMREDGKGAETAIIRIFDRKKPVEEIAPENTLENQGQNGNPD